jgi:hypothetical protein
MSGRLRAVLVLVLVLAAAAPAGADHSRESAPTLAPSEPVVAQPPPPPPPPASPPAEPPSRVAAMVRAGVATSTVALLVVGALLGYRHLTRRVPAAVARRRSVGRRRWWERWLPARPAEADRIEVLSRAHVGARESLGVVRVGRERLLVGITPGQISLLTRLEPAAAPPAPAADDFPAALAAAELVVPRTPEELRRALARSRERLERLSGRRVTEPAPRG